MGKNKGSRKNNRELISESLETVFLVKMLKFFYVNPGWKIFGSGINILDPKHSILQS
jgi:hypothetical protein